jgi:hypothetical protein
MKSDIGEFQSHLLTNSNFVQNQTRITNTSTWRPACVSKCISLNIYRRKICFKQKMQRKMKRILCSIYFFRKCHGFRDNEPNRMLCVYYFRTCTFNNKQASSEHTRRLPKSLITVKPNFMHPNLQVYMYRYIKIYLIKM